tara:strand:+ start:7008 stop:7736 length:729 start_codon:yes stop_codon:yes gene_type:complete
MKALILAGGRGSRINEIYKNINKCLMPLNGKTIIEYNLDTIKDLDISEVIIVVGYKAEEIINKFGNNYKGKRIKYVIQWEQRGLVNAIEYCKELIDEDFLLLLGDELFFRPDHNGMLRKFQEIDVFAMCGVVPVSDIKKISNTYSIFLNDKNTIYRLVEKPDKPFNNFMGTGNCVFKKEIFQYIEKTPINYIRKEKELPDLIQCAIDDGRVVKSYNISSNYFNINSKEDMDEALTFFEGMNN